MKQDRQAIRRIVIDALRTARPDNAASPINDDTLPIGDLGLVSADGVDFALVLEDRLQCKIDDRVNPLVSDNGRRARNVKEIVEWIEKSQSVEEENPTNA